MQVNQQVNNVETVKGVNIETTTLKMNQNFQCTGAELFRALTAPEVSEKVRKR